MDKRDLALNNEILRGVVGSTALGTALEGQDDRDEMGICVEPPEYVAGLEKFEQYHYRTQPEGVRSGPGDLDLVIYSLRKYAYLAVAGNPSIINLLWLPSYEIVKPLGQELLNIREAFVCAEAGHRFLGYLISQRKALTGERSKKVSRPELVAKHGYDTKFAMHALRLGLQGIEYLSQGKLTLPIPNPTRETLLKVRRGEILIDDVLLLIRDAEEQLQAWTVRCNKTPDRKTINDFLIKAHGMK